MSNWSPFTILSVGLVTGLAAGIATGFAFAPIPLARPKCETYFVSNKVATSYVLKPPFQPAVEKTVAIEPETQSTQPENPQEKAETKSEETPTRRHRHRSRRHWRRW